MEVMEMKSSTMIERRFWKGKRVLLTGHTGFKGSWLSIWLQTMGAHLRGIALAPPTSPALFEVARVAEYMEHNIIDIRDYSAVKNQIDEFQPEIVIHLAAQPLVRLSYNCPIETYETNVMGTVHVLEAARNSGSVRAIVNVTTDKCYENREWLWGYRENEAMGGHDPYSSSKGCAELVSSAYRKSFFNNSKIALATARAGNVIGGGDWASDRLIPDIFRALELNETILIRNPQAIRPWQHVLEPLYGYLLLAQNLYIYGHAYAEAWNFGPHDEDTRNVQFVVENLCNKWNHSAKWKLESSNHPHEANFLKLDISKACQHLQWVPQWRLETAIEKIIEWHKAWLNGKDMRSICIEQIDTYRHKISA